MIEGIDTFRDFAEDVRDIDVEAAVERAVEQTADDYIDVLTSIIRRETTAKGGTFDSRTSPYEPGTTNDSSDDSLHISDPSGWMSYKESESTVVVQPKPAVADRARMMEFGTPDHGPKGDTPMFFRLDGMTIVVTEEGEGLSDDAPLGERFDQEPGEVEGVDAQNFFSRAYQNLVANQRLKKNLEDELEKEAREAMA